MPERALSNMQGATHREPNKCWSSEHEASVSMEPYILVLRSEFNTENLYWALPWLQSSEIHQSCHHISCRQKEKFLTNSNECNKVFIECGIDRSGCILRSYSAKIIDKSDEQWTSKCQLYCVLFLPVLRFFVCKYAVCLYRFGCNQCQPQAIKKRKSYNLIHLRIWCWVYWISARHSIAYHSCISESCTMGEKEMPRPISCDPFLCALN